MNALPSRPGDGSAPQATLVDAAGTRQVVGFYGTGPRRTFGAVHLPRGRATAGVVICPALHSDFERTYRRDVLLGRTLCAQGYAVHRFHYRGLGNSEGVPSDATFDTMREDALLAAERLRGLADVQTVGFAGTRWGGLVAASAAADHHGAPVVLWEPPIDTARYFREAGRARAVRDAKEGRQPTSWDSLLEDLQRSGSIDVLGYAIDEALYRGAAGRTLLGLLGSRPRPVLLVQLGRGRSLSADYRAVVDEYRRRGFEIETGLVEGEGAWWFVGGFWEPVETRRSTSLLIEMTTAWIARWLSSSSTE